MKIPLKQMFNWKTGNIAPTIIGIWFLLLPLLLYQAVDTRIMLLGFTFLGIAIVRASSSPTVLGALFSALIGLAYFFGFMSNISPAIMWTLSIVLFALVCIFEFRIFSFGPSNAKAKALSILPLGIMGFSLLLGAVGYNPALSFQWSQWMIAFFYVSVMLFCWIYVLEEAGWKPFKTRTTLLLNLLAFVAVGLSILGMMQGTLITL
jgi:hypothetical protein